MKKILLLILTVCITISLFPAMARADDGVLGGTGITVYPIYDTNVVMEEEIIDIVVKDGRTYVKCQFFFHNTGDKETLLVGFPTQRPGGYKSQEDFDGERSEDEYYNEFNVTELYRFRTYVDGKRVPVKIKKGLEPEGNNSDELYFPQWYTWNMTIGKGKSIKVVNTYYMENSYGGENCEYTEYILRSGATWKGTIGKITVRMKFESYDMFGVIFDGMAPSYVKEDGTIVWRAENIEPKEDISAIFETPEYYEYLENPFVENTPEYKAYDRMGIRMFRNFNIKHYNGTTWWGNKFLRKFKDNQSSEFYYVMGYSYYKLGRYKKALKMFDKALENEYWSKESCLYYMARVYEKIGDHARYKEYLQKIVEKCSESDPSMVEHVDWALAWAQSRLKDMEVALDNGAMLEDIAAFLNLSEENLNEKYGDDIKWVRFNDPYSEYVYDDMGINIVCLNNEGRAVKYIELDSDKISFRGIDSSMNFEEVMSILGKTEVITNEDRLPGLFSYELRYVFDGVKVRIYSWDKYGNGGIYMSVVDDFLPEYRQIRITTKQISHFFDLTKEELEKELGKGELLYSEEWLEYPEFGASFRYDEQGKQMFAMDLDGNYLINDLKQGLSLKDTMKVMGKRTIKKHATSEDGFISKITYKFENFRLDVWTLESEGWDSLWDIRGIGITDADIYGDG